MKILVACEESQAVTIELRKLGHEAYSCDIEPCSGGHPEWHIQQDVMALINGKCYFYTVDGTYHDTVAMWRWDMIIAFPPCTYLTVTGNRWFNIERYGERAIQRYKDREEAIKFFMIFTNADCPRIAIENPIGIMSTEWRKPNQIIQPWQYGDDVGKSTCLWLKGLPKLIPSVTQRPSSEYHTWVDSKGRTKRQEKWYYETRCLPHILRGRIASKTFPGIAKAMAEQWAGLAHTVKDA